MIGIKDFLKADFTNVSNLLFDCYKKIGMKDQEFLFYLQLLKFNQAGNLFPDLADISRVMTISVDELFSMLQSLIDKGFISIETQTNDKGQKEDRYDLSLIYDRLNLYIEQEEKKANKKNKENEIGALYQTFEVEFGRPLSPIEFETIQNWLTTDNYDVSIIQLALREAVLNQAYSLKYMDRILLSWERKNLKTKEQVQDNQKKRLASRAAKEDDQKEEELPYIPMFNWLKSEQTE